MRCGSRTRAHVERAVERKIAAFARTRAFYVVPVVYVAVLVRSTYDSRRRLTGTVLCIDPGVTTGAALLDDEGRVIDAWEERHPYTRLRQALSRGGNSYREIICEKGPDWGRHNVAALETVERAVQRAPHRVIWITPSQWKHTPHARRAEVTGLPKHARDAARMGNWHLRRRH